MMDGKRQPFSGASEKAKGDVKSDKFLGEAKQTADKSISIKQEWLIKIDEEAMAQDRYPILAIEFLNMPKRNTKDWILIPSYVFEELVNE